MEILSAIAAHLLASPDLGGRTIEPGKIPQNAALPAVRFLRVGGVPIVSHDGTNPLWRIRVQFDGIATKMSQASEAQQFVAKELVDFQGVLGGVGGVEVQAFYPVGGPRDIWDETLQRWSCQQDYYIMYIEEV